MAGFFGKFFIFEAALAQGHYWLATLGILFSVVAAYYYLRIIKVMFFDEPVDPFDQEISFERRAVLFIAILFVMGFALSPNLIVDSAMSVASSLF